MKSHDCPTALLAGLLLPLAAVLILSGCGSSGNPGISRVALPVVTLSPSGASVQVGSTIQFTAIVVSPSITSMTWAVNGIQGGNSTIGTVTGASTSATAVLSGGTYTLTFSGVYTAPATVPNPATITVKAVTTAETNPSDAALITVTSVTGNGIVSVAPDNTLTSLGSSVQYTATVTGEPDSSVSWYVDGTAGGNSTVGTISADGLYQAPASMPSPSTVAITVTSNADTTKSASTALVFTGTNTAPLYVNLGPNGNTGSLSANHYNGLSTTVTVCLPSTPVCQIVPNILVDTSSVGLRLLNTALTNVPQNAFGVVSDSVGNRVQECVQFPDTSYAWGPVIIADVAISGERASAVPIQVLGSTTYPVPFADCLTLGAGPNLNTVAALGANGILGIGPSIQDCGPNCAGGQTFSAYPYYVCPLNVCRPTPLPIAQQVTNPVALFPQDNNGAMIALPSIPAEGAPSLPFVNADGSGLLPAGQLVFGVGTESNNSLGSAALYALDESGNFAQVVYNSNTYPLGGAVNSGAKALYLADPVTLGMQTCMDNPYYCPSSTAAVSLGITGANGASGTVMLNVANADNLFSDNAGFSAFNDLALPSLPGASPNLFDLGLPFFFGRNVFVGIAGRTVPNGANAPNGYFAF